VIAKTAFSLLEPPNVELADIQKLTNTERLHGYIEFQGASQITHFLGRCRWRASDFCAVVGICLDKDEGLPTFVR
jgi:hypothetical protein